MPALRREGTAAPDELMFFKELGEVLKLITFRDDEVGFARQLEQIGIVPGQSLQFEKLAAPVVAGLKRTLPDAQTLAAHRARSVFPVQPGARGRAARTSRASTTGSNAPASEGASSCVANNADAAAPRRHLKLPNVSGHRRTR